MRAFWDDTASLEIEVLQALAARGAGPRPPSLADFEEALGQAAARLIVLEARLQNLPEDPQDDQAPTNPAKRSLLWADVQCLRRAIAEVRQRADVDTNFPFAGGVVFPVSSHAADQRAHPPRRRVPDF